MASSESKINRTGSEVFWEHYRDPGVSFSLQGVDGVTQVMSWDPTKLKLPGGPSTLNTGASPNVASESSLSLVLQHEMDSETLQKYSLSAKAVQGILRRRQERLSSLPTEVSEALSTAASGKDAKTRKFKED